MGNEAIFIKFTRLFIKKIMKLCFYELNVYEYNSYSFHDIDSYTINIDNNNIQYTISTKRLLDYLLIYFHLFIHFNTIN